MTSIIEHDQVLYVEGYTPPAWAEYHLLDANFVVWSCGSAAIPIKPIFDDPDADPPTISPMISRHDKIEFDGETLGIRQGGTYIFIGDDVEVTPADARKLAQALVELADLAEGGREAARA